MLGLIICPFKGKGEKGPSPYSRKAPDCGISFFRILYSHKTFTKRV